MCLKMTSLLWRHVYIEHTVSAVFCSFTTCQVLNTIASYEYQKNVHVQRWNLFTCQTSMFYFSTYRPNLFKHIQISECLLQKNDAGCRSSQKPLTNNWLHLRISCEFLLTQQTSYAKHVLGSCKTPDTIHWTHLRVNGIWARSFWKWITEYCSLWDAFNGNVSIFIVYTLHHSDVIVIKLTGGTHN